MKTLCLFLLFVNVVVFFYEYRRLLAESEQLPTDALESIVLLTELPDSFEKPKKPDANNICLKPDTSISNPPPLLSWSEANLETADESAEPPPQKPSAIYCYQLGPFEVTAVWQAWMERMSARYSVNVFDKPERIAIRFSVKAAFNNDELLAQAMQVLKAHRMTDFYPYRTAQGDKELSLGVFSTEIRALTQQKQLQALGITAQITPQYKVKNQKFLLVQADKDITSELAELPQSRSNVSVIATRYEQGQCVPAH